METASLLYALADRPEVVIAGDFDPNVDGDEILVVRETVAGEAKNEDDWRAVIYTNRPRRRTATARSRLSTRAPTLTSTGTG